jgi:hypothetical protein
MVFAHPLQIVRIVSASFKFASIPRPKTFALGAEHLIASLRFVNKHLAIGARFGIGFEKGNRSDGVRVADMVVIIAMVLEFSAVRACVLVTSGAFPSGRHESIAVGVGAAMNELIGRRISALSRIITLQLLLCLHEIVFE